MYDHCLSHITTRAVHQIWQPVQLDKLARRHLIQRLRRSDAGSELDNPTPRGRLSVFHFKTHDTRPELNLYPFWQSITNFQPDPTRSGRYPLKSRPDFDGSSHISVRPQQIQLDLTRSGQKCSQRWNSILEPIQPETD